MTRTRFAPAPTGVLHLGHVVNAIHVWGLGRRCGADVLLRIEDHDRQRSRPEYERAILDDLDWLGFVPDRFPTAAFRAGPCQSRQSDRGAVYAAAAGELIDRGLVYGCACSRRQIDRHRALVTGEADPPCPGHCAERALPLTDTVSWRLRLPGGDIAFVDLLAGRQLQSLPSGEDVVIRDRLGNWTYQFAVVVDDLRQEVDLVIRGRDLLESTGRQIAIARPLGRVEAPAFAHHALVMQTLGQKLSKSDRASGIAALRAAGWPPARVIGEAAARVGLVPPGTALPAIDVAQLFA